MKLFFRIIIISSLLSLAFAKCQKNTEPTSFHLSGFVYDTLTKEAIAGALLEISETNKATLSNASGYYSFNNIPLSKNKYTLTTSNPFFEKKITSFEPNTEKQNLNIFLAPYIAQLVISPNSLVAEGIDFSNNLVTQSFSIQNTGNTPTQFHVRENKSWLSCSPNINFIDAGETKTILCSINRATLEAGNYQATIIIEGNGQVFEIQTYMTVNDTNRPPVVAWNIWPKTGNLSTLFTLNAAASADLETPTDQLLVRVKWDSNETFSEWTNNKIATHQYSTDGIKTITLQVSDGTDIASASETIVVTNPKLYINPTTIDFATTINEKSISIQNSGSGTLNLTIDEQTSWLSVAQTSASLMQNQNLDLSVTVDRKNLPPANYSATIAVSSDGGSQTIDVSMAVPEAPVLAVNQTSFDFGTATNQLNLLISNSGTGTLDFSITENTDWLTLTKTTGSVADVPQSITLSVNRTGLPPDNYSATIAVSSDGGSQTIDLSMTVPEAPVLAVNQTSFDFGTATNQLNLLISNTGTGTLVFSITENTDWLTLTKTTGSVADVPQSITLSVNRTGLPPGNYSATIAVSSDGSSQTIDVSMVVPEAPVLAVNQTSFDFGTATNQLNLLISNTGTGTLDFSITENTDWLTLTKTTGSVADVPQSIPLSVNRTGLPPDNYSATIAVSSDGGSQTLQISMEVGPPGDP